MKFLLILFTFFYSYSFSQTEILYSNAFNYRETNTDWGIPKETKIKITIDSNEVHIYSKEHQYFLIASKKQLEDGSTKIECLDTNSLLCYIYRKEENGIIQIIVDYYDYFISYNCKTSFNE